MKILTLVCGCLLLLAVGGSLRFYRLGDWPFFGDELATITETESLFEGRDLDPDSQLARLPRMIPLSHSIHELGYRLFGKDERGSRWIVALVGTLTLPLLFLGLAGPLGYRHALVTTLLIALWPEHVIRSQENRFYAFAFLAASVSMILAAQAVHRRSLVWTVLAVLACVASVFVHTVLAVLIAGFGGGLLMMMILGQDRAWAMRALVIVGLGMGLLGLVYLLHVRPLLGHFNEGIPWAHSGIRNLMGATLRLGMPTVLFALAGAYLALGQRREQDSCWLSWAALWGATTLMLPLVLPTRPGYSFALALGIFVLAGKGVAEIATRVGQASPRLDLVWIVLACGFNLPALASHYMDGSRGDSRAAAQFISHSEEKADGILAVCPDSFDYYASSRTEVRELHWHDSARGLKDLETARQKYQRFWVVLHYHRAGRPEALLTWLRDHGRLRFSLNRLRLDYDQNSTDIFLVGEESGRHID